jgi:hypothetical protein
MAIVNDSQLRRKWEEMEYWIEACRVTVTTEVSTEHLHINLILLAEWHLLGYYAVWLL